MAKHTKHLTGFMEFIREQGVVGLAVGFILGGAVSKIVAALVNDLVNPLLAPLLSATGDLQSATLDIGPFHFLIGHFIGALIDFLVIAFVVYFGVKILKLDQLDKKE